MVEKDRFKENPYDLKYCTFLGKGNNGEVYLLPNGNLIKIFFITTDFVGEYSILERVNGNKYFPKIYEIGSNYMVRECAQGELLSNYILNHGMSNKLAHNIIEMLKEFIKLKFIKVDLRCRDIIVQPDGNLKVIDPKKFYTKYRNFPRHLSKGLYRLGVLDSFLNILNTEDPKLYKRWYSQINDYINFNYNLKS